MSCPRIQASTSTIIDENWSAPLKLAVQLAKCNGNSEMLIDLLTPPWVIEKLRDTDLGKYICEACCEVSYRSENLLHKYDLLQLAVMLSHDLLISIHIEVNSVKVGLLLLATTESKDGLAEELIKRLEESLDNLWAKTVSLHDEQKERNRCTVLLLMAKLLLLSGGGEGSCQAIVEKMAALKNPIVLDSLALVSSANCSALGVNMAIKSLISAQGMSIEDSRSLALFKLRKLLDRESNKASTAGLPVELTDDDLLCECPHPSSGFVSVLMMDYKTLRPKTFLNDAIIDFYLGHLFYSLLSTEERQVVYIFPPLFFTKLTSTPPKNSDLAKLEKESQINPVTMRHRRVKGWTKNVDLFTKEMLVFPICEQSHWFLVLVIGPGLVNQPGTREKPNFVVFDSMGNRQLAAVLHIRQFLSEEWRIKRATEDDKVPKFSTREVKSSWPDKPEQQNGTDCGVFLLHYAEKIFRSFSRFRCHNPSPSLSLSFPIEEVTRKREEMASLLRHLAANQRPDGRRINWSNSSK